MRRVGIWFSPRKWKKFKLDEFIVSCRSHGLELVQIDLQSDIESQGPFEIILHKLVDMMKIADKGDKIAQECIQKLEEYIKRHPEIMVVDPFDAVKKVLDRGEQYRLGQLCEKEIGQEIGFFIPSFTEIHQSCTTEELKILLEKAGIRYPFIMKSLDAQGIENCHGMSLIFSDEGLSDVQFPCVVQNFVNHNATLFKMFCIGERFFVVRRKSIKNFYGNDKKTIFFDSRHISKQNSCSELTQVEAGDALIEPDMEKFEKLAQIFRTMCMLEVFGVDFVIESGSGRCAAVDINVFPGFDGCPVKHHELFTEFLLKKLENKDNSCFWPKPL